MAHSARRSHRRLQPVVDGAITLVYLLQMIPGKMGNELHEACGIAFVALFALHHALNHGWTRRLGRRGDLRSRVALASDLLLTICVAGTALTGVLMSRSVAPALAVPALAHVVRPLHGTLAYSGLMVCALHVGLHVRMLRGYAGKTGAVSIPWGQPIAAAAIGAWAFVRLGVTGKLMEQPSFPDAMTPLPLQLVLHLALCLPFVVVGSLVDVRASNRKKTRGRDSHE